MNHAHLPSSSIGSTSSSLIERVQARDADAWRRLVQLYGPLVDFWVRKAGVPAADAPDVLQEVFLAVARGIPRFRKDRAVGSFRGWLCTITTGKIEDRRRRQGREPPAVGGSDHLQGLAQLAEPEPAEATTPSDGRAH